VTSSRIVVVGSLLLACVVTTAGVFAQTKRDIAVTAVKYEFRVAGGERAEILVTQDDLVRVTLTATDVPHSFTLPDYRIQKRVEPGRDVTFEFRAEKPGRFEFHCSLSNDNCRERGMVGALIVAPKRQP
jgi:heme/copper-type cytochrome/quinol oxidase subunit 2